MYSNNSHIGRASQMARLYIDKELRDEILFQLFDRYEIPLKKAGVKFLRPTRYKNGMNWKNMTDTMNIHVCFIHEDMEKTFASPQCGYWTDIHVSEERVPRKYKKRAGKRKFLTLSNTSDSDGSDENVDEQQIK